MKQRDRITNAFIDLREQMLSLAQRITGNRDDAADAVQEAFVKLWLHRGRFKTARHARGAGMVTVRTTSIDLARRRQPSQDIPAEQATEIGDEITDDDRNLAYEQVRCIIERDLSPRQRLILDMREMRGMEFDDIAEQLNMTAAAVRVDLSRARRRVREIYQTRIKQLNS